MRFTKCITLVGATGLGLSSLLLSACTALSVALDPEFSDHAELYAVSGKQGLLLRQQLRFGPYHTGVVDRDWDSSSAIQVAHYKDVTHRGGFRFTQLCNDKTSHHVDCKSRGESESLHFGKPERGEWRWLLNAENRFDCNIKDENNTSWHLAIAQRGADSMLRGGLFSETSDYHIESIHYVTGSPMATGVVGYQISRKHIVLAAIETIGQGKVWLRKGISTPEAQRLAATASALLLYEPPQDEL